MGSDLFDSILDVGCRECKKLSWKGKWEINNMKCPRCHPRSRAALGKA